MGKNDCFGIAEPLADSADQGIAHGIAHHQAAGYDGGHDHGRRADKPVVSAEKGDVCFSEGGEIHFFSNLLYAKLGIFSQGRRIKKK
jgi:hypothetical protein